MLKENKKTLILTSILILLPMLFGLAYWNKLPDVMATHFSFNNEANGYSNKIFAVFGIPIILLFAHLLSAFITANDPRKKNISNKMFTLILWITPIISLFVNISIYLVNLGIKLNVSMLCSIFIGFIFIVLGNFLPKIRQNYTMGIKLPWTLSNESNWNKTHRLAGPIYIIIGLVFIISNFFNSSIYSWYITMGIFVVLNLIIVTYSFCLHIKNKNN